MNAVTQLPVGPSTGSASPAQPNGQSPTVGVRQALPGFTDPVHDAQKAFRAVLSALSRPTRPITVPIPAAVPAPLTPAGAALLLALCDDATPLWLDHALRSDNGIATWMAFHAGAPIVDDPTLAAFAVISAPAALPELTCFAQGTDESPHTSTTLVVLDATGAQGPDFMADGPGFESAATWTAPDFPADFAAQWAANRARFPRGVDLVVAGQSTVIGLPRTTHLTPAGLG